MKIRSLTVFVLLSFLQAGYSQTAMPADSIGMGFIAGVWYEVSSTDIREGCHCTTIEFEYIPGISYLKQTIHCIRFKKQKSMISESVLKLRIKNNSGETISFSSGFLSRNSCRIFFLTDDHSIAVIINDSKKCLSLLSRNSFIPAHIYNQVLKLLETKGYYPITLQKTSQNCDIIE